MESLMAFIRENLSEFAQLIGGSVRLYVYLTTDSYATVTAAGYFTASSGLQSGDWVFVIITDSVDPATRTTASFNIVGISSI